MVKFLKHSFIAESKGISTIIKLSLTTNLPTGKSRTIYAIKKLISDISTAINKKDKNLIIFLDIAGAFDAIPHNYLIQKLENYGLNAKIINWISSFLSERSVAVKINNIQSDFTRIKQGIPKGSALSSLLFNIYINDIFSQNLKSKIIAYADDITLYNTSKSTDQLHEDLQQDLNIINKWMFDNSLSIQANKCNVMSIGCTSLTICNKKIYNYTIKTIIHQIYAYVPILNILNLSNILELKLTTT